jgi:ATP-dependent Clp protease ATP-binding subunit ClpA
VFERFTDRARKVMDLAQVEARNYGHNYLGSEHLLIGMLVEADGVAGRVLVSLGISLADARQAVLEIEPPGEKPLEGHIPFTPNAKSVLEIALRESKRLGHDYIDTGHMLLGITRMADTAVVIRVLKTLHVTPDAIRQAVIAHQDPDRPVVVTVEDDSDRRLDLLFLRDLGALFQSGRQRLVTQYCLVYPAAAPAAEGVIDGYFRELELPKLTGAACVRCAIDFKDLVDLAVQARLFEKKPKLLEAALQLALNCQS